MGKFARVRDIGFKWILAGDVLVLAPGNVPTETTVSDINTAAEAFADERVKEALEAALAEMVKSYGEDAYSMDAYISIRRLARGEGK